jgi:hypothetical protein
MQFELVEATDGTESTTDAVSPGSSSTCDPTEPLCLY